MHSHPELKFKPAFMYVIEPTIHQMKVKCVFLEYFEPFN